MNVECNFFGPTREAVGRKKEVHGIEEGTTVRDLLAELEAEHDSLDGRLLAGGEVHTSIVVTVNGRNVRLLNDGETTLTAGDVLRISPPVVGG